MKDFDFLPLFCVVSNGGTHIRSHVRGIKLSPGGLWEFTLYPIRQYDGTQELGHTLLGRVPMPASYTQDH